MPSRTSLNISKYSDILIALVIILVVAMLVIPVPSGMVDVLLAFNLMLSIGIVMVAIYNTEPLQFSVFPTLLLITTLFRLALNVSSTRIILTGGTAPKVIEAFGNFVVAGNAVVGFVVFLILVVIQFLVITRGSERVSEVAARFTLDAMPGKQMAIDADLNAGLITEGEARTRRRTIEQEADFYGAMDGASKFVKGDAIAGIIINVINLLGGIAVGVLMLNLDATTALQRFSLLTVGDGLVSQIPALLISTATGIVVTRAAADGTNLGQDLLGQLVRQPRVLFLTGGAMIALGFVGGLPPMPFLTLGALLFFLAWQMQRSARTRAAMEAEAAQAQVQEVAAAEDRKPENVLALLQVDPLEIELGYGLLGLADASLGGDLMERVVMIRRQTAVDLGLVLPYIRVRDNMSLRPNQYVIKLKGIEVAQGELLPDHFLAMDPGNVMMPVPGLETREPAFGLPALWVNSADRERAELAGYTVVDPPAVVATHLTETIRRHSHELLGRQEVKQLVDMVKESHPAVVEDLQRGLSLGEIQKVLQNLLREGISIRDLVTIFETLADYGAGTKDLEMLTEYVRAGIARSIARQFGLVEKVRVITVHPDLENRIAGAIDRQPGGTYLNVEPEVLHRMLNSLTRLAGDMAALGATPLVLTSPAIRPYFKRLTERTLPKLIVLSYNEIDPNLELEAVGMVNA
ncbi:MAG TPA: flagellar biosynthesis protein FlhA [Symbiobacteriaceae bacterium]|nr:flagellar biosynthesis protein FlhA [Symbiobacteriaceae bacterium]